MITTVKIKKDTFKVVTQTYEVGLYVAVYKGESYPSIQDQLCLQVKEADFHRDVRTGKFFEGRVKVLDEGSTKLSA